MSWLDAPRPKRVALWCQRAVGARLVHACTHRLLRTYGVERLGDVSRDRPLLLVANHRSFFDWFVVASVVLRRTEGWRAIYFPVRGRYFYESAAGIAINLVVAQGAMYPPFFTRPTTRAWDEYALARLVDLCRSGAGHLVGFHPEGTRNQSPDPYSLLRAQPGVGRLIYAARPQVVPVFIGGLGNSLVGQLRANIRGGEPVRVHFGAPLDYAAYLAMPDRARTHVAIAELVMERIGELGARDRAVVRA